MENKEIILIAVLATLTSFSTWYVLRTLNPGNETLQSPYIVLILPPLFCLLFIFIRNIFKG